jgi:hypothetical protein
VAVGASRSRSLFRPVGSAEAAEEAGAGAVEAGEAAVAEALVDSAAVVDSGAVVAGRAGDENWEP